MEIDRAVGPECSHVTEELDGLEFAAEIQFQDVGDGDGVSGGQRHGLQRGVTQVGIGRGKAAQRNRHRGS